MASLENSRINCRSGLIYTAVPCRSSGECEVELNVLFPVLCGKIAADARIDANGSFESQPRHSQGALATCSPCCTSEASQHLEVQGVDIVGATITAKNSFRVWYAPVVNPTSPHRRRKLKKTQARVCESREAAEGAVHLLRRLNCWWGRERPPVFAVYVNPVSGSGRANLIWRQQCLPILQAAGIELRVTETRGSKHAQEDVAKIDIEGLDAIVCVGGDGTMSEIVQGLFQRPDWEIASKVPLCMVPGGTGNGMAASAGLWTPATAAHALCKGETRGMDVVSVFQPPGRRYFAFLSFTFGIISNIDIGTEPLRWMGSLRNQFGAVVEILKASQHSANVAVLSSTEAANLRARSKPSDAIATPCLDQLGPLDRFKTLDSAELPEGWLRLGRSAFSLFAVSIMPWLALDFTLIPSEEIDSGEMTMTHLGKMSQWESLQTMLKADDGKIAEVRKLSVEKIAAFILEPHSTGTWLVMDGEVLPLERIFAELHPGICNLIVAP